MLGRKDDKPIEDNYLQLGNDNVENSRHIEYLNRDRVVKAESPEACRLKTVLNAFYIADSKGHKYNETCFVMLLHHLGFEPQFFEGIHNNIKIVRQEDIVILGALLNNRM